MGGRCVWVTSWQPRKLCGATWQSLQPPAPPMRLQRHAASDMMKPYMKTQNVCGQMPDTMAGPRERAGLMEHPAARKQNGSQRNRPDTQAAAELH